MQIIGYKELIRQAKIAQGQMFKKIYESNEAWQPRNSIKERQKTSLT